MEISIRGEATTLHSMTSEDAQDVCSLRNQPQINQYLSSSTPISLEAQKVWMENNAQNKGELYLKIMDKKSLFCGTISIYQINQGIGELGRYICTKPIQAIEAEWLLIQFCFDIMRLDSILCRTAELNTKVWRQHYSFGFIDDTTEILPGKELVLKHQLLTKDVYKTFDYSAITNLIKRLNK